MDIRVIHNDQGLYFQVQITECFQSPPFGSVHICKSILDTPWAGQTLIYILVYCICI